MRSTITTYQEVTMADKVDEIVSIQKKIDELNKLIKPLKKEVKQHMEDNGLKVIQGETGSARLSDAKASNSTSIFTNYHLKDIHAILGDMTREVTEIRVNSKKIDALIKNKTLSESQVERIKKAKIEEEGSKRFTIKK